MTVTTMRQEFRANPRLRAAAIVGMFLAVGALFSLTNISLVRAANVAISIKMLNAPVPETDPFSPLWNRAPAADIPLSAQQMYQPGGGSIQGVQVRGLHDGKRVAFLVSWADSTRNDYVKDMPSDAGAIQLPIDPLNLPYQCMGQSTSLVNIWQWKAAIERTARDTDQPYLGTRNLTSNGICKAVEADGVPPTARSTWRDGRWYVIYSRDLAGAGTGTAPLTPGVTTNAAFAIWDGGNGETRGMKAVSTWIPVDIAQEAGNAATSWVIMGFTGLAAAGAVALAWRLIPH